MRISVYSPANEMCEFAEQMGLSYPDVRKAQVYFLYHIEDVRRARISAITGYAPSTLSSLRNKVCDYAELAEELFLEVVEEVPKVVSVPVRTTYRRCGDVIVPMNYLPDCGEDVPGQQTTYLFKFYTADSAVPVFSKIGTTAKSVNERLRQEIGEYRKKFDIRSVDVCRIYDCGELPPESFESFLRCKLIKQFPGTWKKNDRFFGTDIPEELFTALCDQFANE